MNDNRFQNVPQAQLDVLLKFKDIHPERSINVGSATWHYLASGRGPKALLILVGGSRMAETAFKLISAFENEYRVIVPSYPDVMQLSQIEEGVAAILDAEGVQSVSVLGASFGGMVAQAFVRRYPQRVEKLILSNTAGILPAEYVDKLEKGLKLIGWLPLWLLRSKLRRQILRHAETFPRAEKSFWEGVLSSIVDHMTKDSLRSQFATMLDVHERGFKAQDLAGWQGSILVLESGNDLAFPEVMRQSMHNLYLQAQFVNFPNGGHIPMVTEWEAYNRVIHEFLAEPELELAIS
ncbi:MAG: alpha/beta hydrolase [Burkholderiales bacterium]|nr:alpha/beta hydrolase [Anaerolineae bacterium]